MARFLPVVVVLASCSGAASSTSSSSSGPAAQEPDAGTPDAGPTGPTEVLNRGGFPCVVVDSAYNFQFHVDNTGQAGQFRLHVTASGTPTSPGGQRPTQELDMGPFLIDPGASMEFVEQLTGVPNSKFNRFAITMESSRRSGVPYVQTGSVLVDFPQGVYGYGTAWCASGSPDAGAP